MSETAEQSDAAPEAPAAPRPIHTGIYALYETAAGGRHVVFRRTASAPRVGEPLEEIPAADQFDDHLPDFPPEVLPLLSTFLEHGIPAPIMRILRSGAGPAGLIAQARELAQAGPEPEQEPDHG